jgi:hypothetical protein
MTYRKRPPQKRWNWYLPGFLVAVGIAAFFDPTDRDVIYAIVNTFNARSMGTPSCWAPARA